MICGPTMFPAQYATNTYCSIRYKHGVIACCENNVWKRTYHGSDSRLLGKASCVVADHCHGKREIGWESNDETIPHEAGPDVCWVNLSNHHWANQGHYSVEKHPIGASIRQVGATNGGNHDEHNLESRSNHLYKKRIKRAESKALDNDRSKLLNIV